MNRTFYFLLFFTANILIINNPILATDIDISQDIEAPKKKSRLNDYLPNKQFVEKLGNQSSLVRGEPSNSLGVQQINPKKRLRGKPLQDTYSSLKEYLLDVENNQIDDENELEHAQQATELVLEDEGLLPIEDTDEYPE